MIWFDNAATSFPKPPEVAERVAGCLTRCGGNAGRGAYRSAMAAAEAVYDCRAAVADFFGAASPLRVVFTAGATAALNLAIKGSVRKGDHVLISDLEHNAVFRPVYALARSGAITYDVFPTYAADRAATAARVLRGIEERIRPNTRLLVCTHASNICSAVLPAREIGMLCRRHRIRFILDAAQSAGHLEVNVGRFHADAVCVPAHKGLLGPQGAGMMILGDKTEMNTVIEGGSGVRSLDPEMPPDPPERYEAGTLPLPAIVGLREGLRAVEAVGIDTIRAHEKALFRRLRERLGELSGVQMSAPHAEGSVLLFHADGIPSERLAAELDERGFCVRAGFHCAAMAHKTLGTPESGAVRVSFGWKNTEEETDLLANAVGEIVSAR